MTRIMRCPHIDAALDPAIKDPCARVVGAQWPRTKDVSVEERRRRFEREHELPEPWSGDLERALILFVSSNPSGAVPIRLGAIRGDKKAPRGAWDDERLEDYYHWRFEDHIEDGRYHIENGVRGSAVGFWSGTRGIARQLLSDAAPGRDYVLTELVRCKSRREKGVEKALKPCTDAYLKETLALARNAEVVVALGRKARGWFYEHASPSLADRLELGCVENASIAGYPERTFTLLALGHPSGGEARLPEVVFRRKPEQLRGIRDRLRSAKDAAEAQG
jgi:hypothetical protein